MFFSGNATFSSFAIGTIARRRVAMIGSLTVLPALLSKLGDRVEKGRVPFVAAPAPPARRVARLGRDPRPRAAAPGARRRSSPAASWSRSRSRRSACTRRTRACDGLPRSLPIMKTLRPHRARRSPAARCRPWSSSRRKDVTAPEVRSPRSSELEREALATGQMSAAGRGRRQRRQDASRSSTCRSPATGTDAASNARARDAARTIDPAHDRQGRRREGRRHGPDRRLEGLQRHDEVARCRSCSRSCSALAFLLLLVTFRSIVIPIKAIVLNLLSVGAAYGVLVLVFQDGRGETLLGFKSIGGDHVVAAAVPVRGPVRPLDGLPRVHPQPDPRGRRPRHEHRGRRRHGIKSTAGVVTSAAVVMVAVFAIFATLGALDFKQLGVGLAAAILIDATIVRAVLLPATMKLLGELELVPAQAPALAAEGRARRGRGARPRVDAQTTPPPIRRPPPPGGRRSLGGEVRCRLVIGRRVTHDDLGCDLLPDGDEHERGRGGRRPALRDRRVPRARALPGGPHRARAGDPQPRRPRLRSWAHRRGDRRDDPLHRMGAPELEHEPRRRRLGARDRRELRRADRSTWDERVGRTAGHIPGRGPRGRITTCGSCPTGSTSRARSPRSARIPASAARRSASVLAAPRRPEHVIP